ncbi:MAG: hypothetical protein E7243_19210 [Lacrimispora celerecrescens]|nr:hypothetical protein [Lacrimispora celerecrescens]
MFNIFDRVKVFDGSMKSVDGLCLANSITHPVYGRGYVVSGYTKFVPEKHIHSSVYKQGYKQVELYKKLPKLLPNSKQIISDLINVDNASVLIKQTCKLLVAGIDENTVINVIKGLIRIENVSDKEFLRIASISKIITDSRHDLLLNEYSQLINESRDINVYTDRWRVDRSLELGVYPPKVLHLLSFDEETLSVEMFDSITWLIKLLGDVDVKFNEEMGLVNYFDSLVAAVSKLNVNYLKSLFGVCDDNL